MTQQKRYVGSPMFKMSKQESDLLIKPVHQAIAYCKEGKCNVSLWMDIYVRLMVGLYLIEKHYTKDTLEQYRPAIKAWNDLEARSFITEHKVWDISAKDFELLDMAIEAVDSIQHDSKRKDLLAAYRFASDCLSKRKKNKK